MTAENFCYWLKGIFEIQEAGLDKNEKRSMKLTEAQIEMINQHLGYVFAKPIILPESDQAQSARHYSQQLSQSFQAAIC